MFWGFVFYLLALTCVAIFSSYLAPFSFEDQNLDFILVTPNSTHLFGTDGLGRDLLSRLIYGSRISMLVAVLTTMTSLVIGVSLGAIAGFKSGIMDRMIMGLTEILQSIPTLVLMILVSVVFNSVFEFENEELRSVIGIVMSLTLVGWVRMARLVRGQIRLVKKMAYVESARANGASDIRILAFHIFPNIFGPVIALATLQIPSQILNESFLSFVGLGLQPPYSSWGVLANEGWRAFRTYPHLILFPGLTISITMLAFNFLGDYLRDFFDPRAKSSPL